MKALLRKTISIFLAVIVACAPLTAFASVALGDDLLDSSTTVNKGTALHTGTFWSSTYSDLRQENYVVYTPNKSVTPIVKCGNYATHLTTVTAAAKALEADGYRVVAGINGDYFDTVTGVPLGCVMTDGVLRSVTRDNYAIGFYADGTTIMGKPELTITAQPDGGSAFPVAALNYVRQSTYGIFLYDDGFNARHSIGTSEKGVDVVCSVDKGTLNIGGELTLTVERVLSEAVDTAVAKGQYVLSANLGAVSEAETLLALEKGQKLTVRVTASDEKWNKVTNMIGALYQLVEDGKVCSGLPTGAAPRTALGLTAKGDLILYTIDGRASGYSIGASLSQTAERLVELGCVSAMSLDGGGSTTLVMTSPADTAATVLNRPSDGYARAVTNHVFLVASAKPSGTLDHIALSVPAKYVLPGAKVALSAAAVDTNYIPMKADITYAADRGSVSGNILTAPASGTVSVGAKRGSVFATEKIEVVSKPDTIELLQNGKAVESLTLSRGSETKLTARALYRHLNVLGDNSNFTWSVTGDIGTVSADGVFTAAKRLATGVLTVSVGETKREFPVSITAEPLRALDRFDAPFDTYTGVNAMLSHVTDEAHIRRGTGAARLDYAIYEGVDAEIAMSYPIRAGYDCVNLWVYGDGGDALLRVKTDAGIGDAAALDFIGWRQLSLTLPAGAKTITGLSLSGDTERIGAIFLDQLVLSYAGLIDTEAPTLTLAQQEDTRTLTGTFFDDCDGTAIATLRLTYDGAPLETYTYSGGTFTISLPESDGAQHRVTIVAGDASGNLARASCDIAAQSTDPAFPDLVDARGNTHWANPYVSYLKRVGITTGDERGNYNPNANISRQEFAVMLYRYLAPTEDYSSVQLPFDDNDQIGGWAKDGVRAMYALGVTKGSANWDGRVFFNPTATISRQEAVTMIGRLLEKGYSAPELTFKDSTAIADWAKEYVGILSDAGILTGSDDGKFHPADSMTRAQVATVLYKLL